MRSASQSSTPKPLRYSPYRRVPSRITEPRAGANGSRDDDDGIATTISSPSITNNAKENPSLAVKAPRRIRRDSRGSLRPFDSDGKLSVEPEFIEEQEATTKELARENSMPTSPTRENPEPPDWQFEQQDNMLEDSDICDTDDTKVSLQWCFNFGKHKGRTLQQVEDCEPSYIDWLIRANVPRNRPDLRDALSLHKQGDGSSDNQSDHPALPFILDRPSTPRSAFKWSGTSRSNWCLPQVF
jgi:hypothetical protein